MSKFRFPNLNYIIILSYTLGVTPCRIGVDHTKNSGKAGAARYSHLAALSPG